jgi:hypothetical protein
MNETAGGTARTTEIRQARTVIDRGHLGGVDRGIARARGTVQDVTTTAAALTTASRPSDRQST